jgi:hypothetical protein
MAGLPLRELLCVEHPCVVQDDERAIKLLGGTAALREVRSRGAAAVAAAVTAAVTGAVLCRRCSEARAWSS